MTSHVLRRSRARGASGGRAIAALLAALVAVMAAGGCGGGDDEGTTAEGPTSAAAPTSTSSRSTTTTGGDTPSTAGDTTNGQVGHTSVRQAVDAALVSADPDRACGGDYVTERYLRVAYGGRRGCVQAQSPRSAADDLGSYRARVGGDGATVTVRPAGGLYDGEKITVSLVKEGGSWKVDELKSNAPVGP